MADLASGDFSPVGAGGPLFGISGGAGAICFLGSGSGWLMGHDQAVYMEVHTLMLPSSFRAAEIIGFQQRASLGPARPKEEVSSEWKAHYSQVLTVGPSDLNLGLLVRVSHVIEFVSKGGKGRQLCGG